MFITVIDYGMGNLRSVSKALEKAGARVKVTSNKKAIGNADGLVLPGVGAFSQAMRNLKKLDLIPEICGFIDTGKPFLGICLGLQLLFSESEEGGIIRGLDILKGKVRRFEGSLKVPHMGWNQIKPKTSVPLLSDIFLPCFVYFAHSYYVEPEDSEIIATVTEYGMEFASLVKRNNVFGTQFHPEKSGQNGLKILKNFCALG